MKIHKTIDLEDEELSNHCSYSLSELLEVIPKLQKKYGKHAILSFDAGYYNVWPTIIPSKRIKNDAVNVH